MGLQDPNSKSLSINAISFPSFLTHFLFFLFSFIFFEKKTRLTFFPICLLPNSHTVIGIFLLCSLSQRPRQPASHRLNAECQHFISEKAMLFLQEFVFFWWNRHMDHLIENSKDFGTRFSSRSIKPKQFLLSPAGKRCSRKRDGRWKGRRLEVSRNLWGVKI